MIELMKASAGSGKTSRLTEKYIFLLLRSERYAYRHILAVTFTNKATDEMKGRILEELHVLSKRPETSIYRKDIEADATIGGLKEASRKAGVALHDILHDYSAFSVSTIDKFFQMALKAFSREIGQFADYQVELDKESLVKESVDRVLDSLVDDKAHARTLKWLTDNALENLGKGNKYTLESSLYEIGRRLRHEQHRTGLSSLGLSERELYDSESISRFSRGLRQIQGDYINDFNAALGRLEKAMDSSGFSPESTVRSFLAKPLGRLKGLDPDRPPEEIARFSDSAVSIIDSEPAAWFAKKNAHLVLSATPAVVEALRAVAHHRIFEDGVYATAGILRGQVYTLGVASDLSREFHALVKEKNVLSLDDSNVILRDIINGTDAPFIYEKLGVRFENFLLDEFQDTSGIQWENFVPLLKESVSNADDSHPQGRENLIVGDVKQSIYRFRDSDWRLLQEEVGATFTGYVRESVLDENWRSLENLVNFYGDFFTKAAGSLSALAGPEYGPQIRDIYSDVVQKTAACGPQRKCSEKGRLEFVFTDGDSECDIVYDTVCALRQKGAQFSDIGVLVRTNAYGSKVAEYLISKEIPVITDDSLTVSSSLVVRRLVALLSSVDNPEDRLSSYLARTLSVSFPKECRSLMSLAENLLRQLKSYDRETFESETLYIQSFMDVLKDFVSKEGNSLHSFLKMWKDSSAKISSPSAGDSVRIMTVHKSKGLAFPYVIVPFLESVPLSRDDRSWCHPDVEGTALGDIARGVYDIRLSDKKTRGTLFEKEYRKEYQLRLVDNLNVVYVAFTRAKYGLTVIADDGGKGGNFAEILRDYIEKFGVEQGFSESVGSDGNLRRWCKGDMPAFGGKGGEQVSAIECGYPSWPLNDGPLDEDISVGERGRLKFSSEGRDFFDEDGKAGIEASKRVRGIVLHDILSRISVPEDLPGAVRTSVDEGSLPPDEAESTEAFLAGSLEFGRKRGWFPDDRSLVRTETTIIDTDGGIYRPDRVVDDGHKAMIIDYKFGAEKKSYLRQIGRYADLYRRMGRDEVSAYLWYVSEGKVSEVK